MLLNRANRSYFSQWWWTVDKIALSICTILMIIGLMLSLSASPAVAIKIGLNEMYFVKKQLLFVFISFIVMLMISFINNQNILYYLALIFFSIGIILMLYALIFETKIKGSYRWVTLDFITIQPSEIAKPGFIILISWLYAKKINFYTIKNSIYIFNIYCLFALLLIFQPDMGQTILITIVLFCLYILSSTSIWIFCVFCFIFVISIYIIYNNMHHVKIRIDRFLNPESGDTFQIDMALRSFIEGGWFGKGPGQSNIKMLLPDVHTDFIFAVIGEEFGLVGCLFILILYTLIIFIFFRHAFIVKNIFKKLSIIGLTTMIGMQIFINIGVNLNIIPSKGITLPFISSGGSSLISMGIIMGLLLSLTRNFLYINSYINYKIFR